MLIATQLGIFSSAKGKQKESLIPVDHKFNRFQFFLSTGTHWPFVCCINTLAVATGRDNYSTGST